MNFLLVRLLWFVTLAALVLSFQIEVLESIEPAEIPASVRESVRLQTIPASAVITAVPALPPGECERVEWTERVLLRLEKAEKKEIDPWLRDDIRIAWITTRWSQNGVPDWSLHADQTPYAAATWQVLHCAPSEVWPRIVAARKTKLGSEYSRWYDANDNPQKGANVIPEAAVVSARARRASDGTGVGPNPQKKPCVGVGLPPKSESGRKQALL